jgi:hypothetical protein
MLAENPRAVMGGNKPPSPIDGARPVWESVNQFLKDTPVVTDKRAALAANEILTTAKTSLASLQDAERAEAEPLYSAWKAAKAKYKPAIEGMDRIIGEVKGRLSAYMLAEQAKRDEEARMARQAALEAERIAREAEAAEIAARDDAAFGEIGIDLGSAIATADTAFAEFKKADRQASVAEKDATVRLRSRFQSRATTLRTVETLVLDDAGIALAAIGVTDKIREAILSGAREYRKLNGGLPDGVSSNQEKTL